MQEERQCQGWAAEDRLAQSVEDKVAQSVDDRLAEVVEGILAEVVEDTVGQAVEDRPAEVEGVYLSCPLNLNRSYSRNMISILL